MTSVEEDDNYAEDECTIEFGDEEQPELPPTSSSVVGGPRFIEYPGEDFSKYLSDTPNDYRQVRIAATIHVLHLVAHNFSKHIKILRS